MLVPGFEPESPASIDRNVAVASVIDLAVEAIQADYSDDALSLLYALRGALRGD